MPTATDEAPDNENQEHGDTLHGADAPLESEHDHQEEVPKSDRPENQPKPESEN